MHSMDFLILLNTYACCTGSPFNALLTQDDGGDAGGGVAGGAQVDDARTGVGVSVDGHGEALLPHHREHGGDPGPERVPTEDKGVPRVLLQRRVDLC